MTICSTDYQINYDSQPIPSWLNLSDWCRFQIWINAEQKVLDNISVVGWHYPDIMVHQIRFKDKPGKNQNRPYQHKLRNARGIFDVEVIVVFKDGRFNIKRKTIDIIKYKNLHIAYKHEKPREIDFTPLLSQMGQSLIDASIKDYEEGSISDSIKRLEDLIQKLNEITDRNQELSRILDSIAEQFAKAADKNNAIIQLLSELKKLGTTNELIDKITNSIVENTKNQLKIELKEILKEYSGRDIEESKRLIKEQGIELLKINKDIKLMDRFRAGGKAFIFEGLKKISEEWWVEPIVEAIKAFLEGES